VCNRKKTRGTFNKVPGMDKGEKSGKKKKRVAVQTGGVMPFGEGKNAIQRDM